MAARSAAVVAFVVGVAVVAFTGAAMAGSVDGPVRLGHWVMFAAISLSLLAAMINGCYAPLRTPRACATATG